jgi:hypothetical protein
VRQRSGRSWFEANLGKKQDPISKISNIKKGLEEGPESACLARTTKKKKFKYSHGYIKTPIKSGPQNIE